jgi:hypothetical protein
MHFLYPNPYSLSCPFQSCQFSRLYYVVFSSVTSYNILFRALFLNSFILCSSHRMRDQVSHPLLEVCLKQILKVILYIHFLLVYFKITILIFWWTQERNVFWEWKVSVNALSVCWQHVGHPCAVFDVATLQSWSCLSCWLNGYRGWRMWITLSCLIIRSHIALFTFLCEEDLR